MPYNQKSFNLTSYKGRQFASNSELLAVLDTVFRIDDVSLMAMGKEIKLKISIISEI